MTGISLLWLRRDLRLADQAALVAAAAEGAVIPAYILDEDTPRHRAMGGASRWWLHHSLASLDRDLRRCGSRLILRRGKSAQLLTALAEEVGTRRVHALHHHEPWWRNAEREAGRHLDLCLHHGNYLLPPGALTTGSGAPYRMFTPFLRALWPHMPPASPVAAPECIAAPEAWPESERLEDWGLLPGKPDWAKGFAGEWTPGEAGAQNRLAEFRAQAGGYEARRNLPSEEGTSRLSPHLHFGEISPATIWYGLDGREEGEGVASFRRELVWRDYAQNIIRAFPDHGRRNGKDRFDALRWRDHRGEAAEDLAAWQSGRTGYPIVDAGMRQLWASGWMHNRVRMIATSFLVKHLLIDWRVGESWFWDTLIDADYAQNSVNWQWVAGSGHDANMFSRIMAPLTQSEKFDAGDYIRRWVPELAHIDGPAVHDPDAHGCRPPDYPAKIIGHREGRERALRAWSATKG
ncbi:MAG: deoxyribodipyrimidine photo-lyase [Sphingomonadales bacterium]|nr:MAG: deoxyribodipyrimidine photo-lyase [Sphingomonadales bacterium]TNF02132.1 MAG: deoxyribodipyrimidine photo-lyase [Sphingomonadales bacterium]